VRNWTKGCYSEGMEGKSVTVSRVEELPYVVRGWNSRREQSGSCPLWSNIDTGWRLGLYGRRNRKVEGNARELNGLFACGNYSTWTPKDVP
jgi:hypothetical protein